jgi:hypothetical protein
LANFAIERPSSAAGSRGASTHAWGGVNRVAGQLEPLVPPYFMPIQSLPNSILCHMQRMRRDSRRNRSILEHAVQVRADLESDRNANARKPPWLKSQLNYNTDKE